MIEWLAAPITNAIQASSIVTGVRWERLATLRSRRDTLTASHAFLCKLVPRSLRSRSGFSRRMARWARRTSDGATCS